VRGRFSTISILTLSSAFGLGYLPLAPGTWGTLLGIPLVYVLHASGPFPYLLVTLLFTVFAVLISEGATRIYGEEDCQKIVIDEVAGFIVTMAWLPMTWQAMVAGFVLFRVLDAWKPGPIGYVDRKIKGGLGVVTDDIAAGIVANIVLQIIYVNTSWLGAQLPPS
jgi:phosphatidylglycerophosphatase A